MQTPADSAAAAGLPTGIVVGASQNQKILINGLNCSTGTTYGLVAGDTFTIAGCYAVNPMSGESTGSLRSFVVTTHAYPTVSTTDMDSMVYFQPDMICTGPYKTVDTVPQLSAAVQIFGVPGSAMNQNLAFHKNAFALCMVPLEVPQGASFSTSVTEDGYSIRVIKDYDITNDQEIIRLDILYGVKTRPRPLSLLSNKGSAIGRQASRPPLSRTSAGEGRGEGSITPATPAAPGRGRR